MSFPLEVPCHACTHKYAGAVCPICKEERPVYTALKAAKKPVLPEPLPPCRYSPAALCGCGSRGECLETV